MAASDGRSFFRFDYLVGRVQGRIHDIGREAEPLRRDQCTPAHGGGLAIALGSTGSGVSLVAIDRAGELAWRETIELGQRAVSAPVVIDDLVAFAVLAIDSEGSELRLIARRVADGAPAFDALIAKLPVMMRPWVDQSAASPPALRAHAGSFLILSNAGVMARVLPDGAVARIWTYPSLSNDAEDPFDAFNAQFREGRLDSDGAWAVATPSDAEGLVLLMGPDDVAPRTWTGDGSHGVVLDVREGVALIGSQRLVCLDLARGEVRWGSGDGERNAAYETALIGGGRALVGGREMVALIDLADGAKQASDRGAEPSFATAEGMFLVGRRGGISAFGRAQEFLARQEAAAAADPSDYRPHVALSALHLARGDEDRAFDHLGQALARGAPVEYAEKAARLLRGALQLALDEPLRFADRLGRLEALVTYDPRLAGELALWRGWNRELARDADGAAKQYQLVLAGATLRVPLADGLEAQAQALARAGLARLGRGDAPLWSKAPNARAANPSPATPWRIDLASAGGAAVAADAIVLYAGGFLAAHGLVDGVQRWQRKPDKPMLGIQGGDAQRIPGQEPAPGIEVKVLPGSAAAGAGMVSGDILTSFNGKPVRSVREDLIPLVQATPPGGAFTVEVLRQGEVVKLSGSLGGDKVGAIGASARSVLVWPLLPEDRPEGTWLAAHDLADGRLLWRGTLPPAVDNRALAKPLLTDDDLLITIESDDLIAIDLRTDAGARERWRLVGQAAAMEDARLVGRLLVIADAIDGRGRLIDPADGQVIASVPLESARHAVLGAGDLIARDIDGRLSCWDLGWGRLRWKTERPVAMCLAAHGDAVFVQNERHQLTVLDRISGKQRRLYGDWSSIEDEPAVVGDRVHFLARRLDLGLSLAAVALDGGAVLWEQPLPRGVEIQRTLITGPAPAIVLGDNDGGTSVMALAHDGGLRHALKLNEGETVHLAGEGLVATGGRGVRALVAAPLPALPPVPCPVAPGGDLAGAAEAVKDKLVWQEIGSARYALARAGASLLVFIRLPAECPGLELRVADTGPAVDGDNQRLTFQRHRAPHLTEAERGWRLGGSHRLPGGDEDWATVVRLEPLGELGATLPLQVRAASAAVSDGAPDAPWWLRQGWRPVVQP